MQQPMLYQWLTIYYLMEPIIYHSHSQELESITSPIIYEFINFILKEFPQLVENIIHDAYVSKLLSIEQRYGDLIFQELVNDIANKTELPVRAILEQFSSYYV